MWIILLPGFSTYGSTILFVEGYFYYRVWNGSPFYKGDFSWVDLQCSFLGVCCNGWYPRGSCVSILELLRFALMNEWLIPYVVDFASLDMPPAWLFCSLGTCNIFDFLNLAFFPLAKTMYHYTNSFLVWASPLTYEIMIWHSVLKLMICALVSAANVRPTITASYSTWLLVVENSKHIDTSISRSTSFSRIRLSPLPRLFNDMSANTT